MALSSRDKQKIADLRKRQRSSLVFRGGKKLSESEMTQRRAGIERDIRGIESRAGVAPRPSPRRSSVPSVSDTNINDLIVSNLGQQGGLPTPRAPRVTGYEPSPRRSSIPSVSDTNINELIVRNLGQQGGLPTTQPTRSFPYAINPKAAPSRIPSIYSQYYSPQDPLRSITGPIKSNINILPDNIKSQYMTNKSESLMDMLERDTGGFPSALPRPTVEPVTDTNINDILVSNLGQQGGLPPMTTDGRSFSRPYGTQRGISLGTVGGFGRGLFDALASSGGGYFPQPQPDVQLTIGDLPVNPNMLGIDKNAINRMFLNTAINSYMGRPFVGKKGETRLPNVNVTSSPYMTLSPSLENFSVRPRGVGTDIYGNPRTYTGQELEPMYRTTIRGLLGDRQYTLY